MNVRLLESDILFAFLPAEPLAQPELRLLWKHLYEHEPLHLIVDLSRVEIITSPSIGTLLLLRQLQSERRVRLLLCKPRLATRCILRVVGLESVFDYAEDKPGALKILSQWRERSAEGFDNEPESDPVPSRPWLWSAPGRMRT
jgi:anti-anti-sigma regulatory factor